MIHRHPAPRGLCPLRHALSKDRVQLRSAARVHRRGSSLGGKTLQHRGSQTALLDTRDAISACASRAGLRIVRAHPALTTTVDLLYLYYLPIAGMHQRTFDNDLITFRRFVCRLCYGALWRSLIRMRRSVLTTLATPRLMSQPPGVIPCIAPPVLRRAATAHGGARYGSMSDSEHAHRSARHRNRTRRLLQ